MKSRTINREFYITRLSRRYDKQTGNYVYDIRYRTVTDITPRTIDVAEAFGLGMDETREYVIYDTSSSNSAQPTSSTSPATQAPEKAHSSANSKRTSQNFMDRTK